MAVPFTTLVVMITRMAATGTGMVGGMLVMGMIMKVAVLVRMIRMMVVIVAMAVAMIMRVSVAVVMILTVPMLHSAAVRMGVKMLNAQSGFLAGLKVEDSGFGLGAAATGSAHQAASSISISRIFNSSPATRSMACEPQAQA